jgi:murein L,D-transpeptidase YcbB/YkuD
MRGSFHRHLAATAILLLAATSAALAQSDPGATAQRVEEATPIETQPPTGENLLQVPIAASLTGNDAEVAGQIRELIAAKLNRVIERKQDRAGVEAFYRDRGFAPLWVSDGASSSRAKQAVAFLRGVGADGLNPTDYPAPGFANSDPAKLAQDELGLTNSILTFARHARTGRISFSRVSGAIYYDLQYPEPAGVLGKIADAGDVGAALNSYYPQHRDYKALKAKLAEARSNKKGSNVADTLIANMERWRWMSHDLGAAHVVVNIPDYSLKVVNQDKTVWSTRIVVGKVGNQATPLMSETMKFITVNPTWNVPPSIIRNEYLPALQRDPNALARVGLKVVHNSDGTIRVYQPPGARNALGRIRFNFPNKFLVYQHDTPDKHLFARTTRAYSHGCMRVQHPEKYAEVLLSISQPGDGFTAERIRKMYGSSERTINLKTPIPVHLTYQTAFVDDAGQLQVRPDIYGHDRAILALLRNGRDTADTPVARNYNSSSKPVVARLPSRSESYGYDRRAFGYIGPNDERIIRRYEFGSTALPRRVYGTPY